MHDLEIVAVLDANLSKCRSRDYFQVPLDGDPQRIEAKAVDHFGDREPAGDSPVLAIHADTKAAVETHRKRT
jgi:hypothetical protein